jgi:hypothetical protein
LAGAVAGLAAAIAIGVMEWFSLASHFPLFIVPFATSIVLVIGSPEAEPAQPRAPIGGRRGDAAIYYWLMAPRFHSIFRGFAHKKTSQGHLNGCSMLRAVAAPRTIMSKGWRIRIKNGSWNKTRQDLFTG